jgi:putative peptidoglycan lipid II flippase
MGFIRDMLIANIFGVSAATDAFFVAFKIPNFLRRLFAEGAFAHAFVPALSDYQKHNNHAALKSFIAKTTGALALMQILLSAIGIMAAPMLITLFAPGFLWEDGQFELAVQMLQITFPYLLFISLTSFAGGILNAHGKFAVPAITPVFLNLCMIIAAIWISPLTSEPIISLAWGVFAAGIVQLLFQIPALLELDLLPAPRLGFNDPAVKRIIQKMIPAIFGVSVVQLNLLIDTFFASFLIPGSVSWLYYSDRLVEFPLGIFGVAVSTVILPGLAKNYASADAIAFSKSLDWALKLVLLIGLPATIGLTLLAEPLLSTLFQYNEFGANDVRMTTKSLTAFSLGLQAFILIKVLVPGFTARHDTQTPVRFGMYSILVNLFLNGLLFIPLAHAGPALATTIAAYFNAILLLRTLLKDNVYQPCRQWPLFLGQVGAAAGIMTGFLIYFVDTDLWLYWNASQRGLTLLTIIAFALLIYLCALWLIGLRPQHLLLNQS